MTKKELKELENRHFAPSKNLTWYCVCFACDKPCALTQEEWSERDWNPDLPKCCTVVEYVYSPLPKADFEKLVDAMQDDQEFWEKSLSREDIEDLKNDR